MGGDFNSSTEDGSIGRGGLRGTSSWGGSAGPVCEGRLRGTGSLWGLRGTSPALAGNVGTGGAFARPRDGDQDVDVPTLAPDRSRCRCRFVVAQEGSGEARRRSAPTGHRIPAQGETLGYGTQPERSEGTPHTPGFSRLFCSGRAGAGAGDQCLDGVWRISAGGAPRDMSRCGLVASKGLG